MVGRDGELAAVTGALAEAFAGVPRTVAVIGEAGIGKTRLAEEAVAVAVPRHGALALWGRCWDSAGSPAYWPWVQVLEALDRAIGAEAMDALLADRAAAAVLLGRRADAAAPAASPEAAKARLFTAVAGILESVSTDRPLLVVLEDMHWADPESIELTDHVLGSARTGRLGLLVTVRNPDERPLSEGEALLAALSRLPAVQRIELHGLAPEDVKQYAERMGQPVDDAAARALRERTDGNPFYIGELVRLLADERRAAGRAGGEVPSSVRAVIERRLRHLPAADRDMLAAAAVIGRSFDLDVLAEVTRRDLAALLDGLDRASVAGVLLPAPDAPGRHRFAHALVQETLATTAGPMRRAALHGQVALALERRHAGALEEHAAQIAHHHAAAGAVGDPAAAVRFTLLAAGAAQRQLAFSEAQRHLRRAIELVTAVAGSEAPRLELEARVALGSLLTLVSGYNAPEVASERRRALELATATGSTEHLMSALWGTWGNALVSGRMAEADELAGELGRAAQRTGDPVLELAYTHALGQVRWHQGRLAEARQLLERAAALADAHPDRIRLEIFLQHPAAASRGWLSVVLAMMGLIEESDRVAAEAWRLAGRLGDPYTSNYVFILDGWRGVFLDRPQLALDNGLGGTRTAGAHGFGQLAAFSLPPLGWGRARAGDPVQGEADVLLAIELFSSQPTGHMFGAVMHGALADIRLLAGRPQDALEAADIGVRQAVQPGELFYLAEIQRLRAAALHTLSGSSGAAEAADEAIAAARQAVATATAQGAALFARRAQLLLDRLAGAEPDQPDEPGDDDEPAQLPA